MAHSYLPSNVVDDLPEFEVVEQCNVVDSLLPQLVTLLVSKHVGVGTGRRSLRLARQVHL